MKYLYVLLAGLAGLAVLYGITCFILWEIPNLAEWETEARLFFVCLCLFFVGLPMLGVYDKVKYW